MNFKNKILKYGSTISKIKLWIKIKIFQKYSQTYSNENKINMKNRILFYADQLLNEISYHFLGWICIFLNLDWVFSVWVFACVLRRETFR